MINKCLNREGTNVISQDMRQDILIIITKTNFTFFVEKEFTKPGQQL